jgi:hypothetical protein
MGELEPNKTPARKIWPSSTYSFYGFFSVVFSAVVVESKFEKGQRRFTDERNIKALLACGA